ncbi:exodeoxyribonuclease I [Candidatus Saccharibacteria bacterium]|nr:exodeoxyribonuclease I [Candidatus Saccharibacteria bacterium]
MKSFFFYDLETSGLNARDDRIMQFAGQRTDMDLNPIGEPVNLLVKLANDTLPSPGAILVTKITPQQTQQDGIDEADFCDRVVNEFFTKDTCAVGYNSIRFDDEFMRNTLWRNFREPYAWQWKEGRSRWDLLDVVRLTRALRPGGIKWPTTKYEITDKKTGEKAIVEGATNRLELITKLNGIEHTHAHDALADVFALIEVTKLIRTHQPKLYNYLFEMRDKRKVAKLVNLDNKKPFVYASGRYSGKYQKTTVAFPLTAGRNGNIVVFDLRYNLDELLKEKNEQETEELAVEYNSDLGTGKKPAEKEKDDSAEESELKKKTSFFPIVKELCLNKCPAVAPLGVLDVENNGKTGWEHIELTKEQIDANLQSLLAHPEFAEQMREQYENRDEFPPAVDSESALYDGFLSRKDEDLCAYICSIDEDRLADFHPEFEDERLPDLLLHYKAKNFPSSLSKEEEGQWEKYRFSRLNRQAPNFTKQIEEMQSILEAGGTENAKGQKIDPFILEELSLWYQSLL